ncbi:MAG TPA: carboxypeptidase-like regulatory domain-containing protein [Candidatus Bathyarchaeia archaeon]|nr:carboxypeptidase-like regulatory domain-containing protein [Candidatus Bathyarchaeia archaeon]
MIPRLLCPLLLAASLLAQAPPPAQNTAGFPVAGSVVDSPTGQPLPDVHVSLYPSDDPDSAQRTTTAANGHFSFSAVPAGKYILTGSARGYRSQGYHQHGDYFIGITVAPNLDSTTIRFPLVPDARIEGRVTDDEGEPIRNTNVALYQRSYDTGHQHTIVAGNAVTDDRGHYLFSHLGPGIYFVSVSAHPWFAQYSTPTEPPLAPADAGRVAAERAQLDVAYPMTFYPSAQDSNSATPIALHPGERFSADISLQALPAVHLRVKPAAGQPPGGVSNFPRVSQRIFEGTVVPVTSSQGSCFGSAGCEYTGIAPGHYLIEMQDPGAKANPGWFKEMDLSSTVELNPSEYPPLVKVRGALAVQGSPRPRGKMYVILINRASSEDFAAEVSPKGTFDFSEMTIRPGVYDIAINTDPGFRINGLLANGAKLTGTSLLIAGGNVQLAVTITRALGHVTGVILHDNQPYAGAMVVLVPSNPSTNLSLFRRDESDSDGTFNLREVLPGTYSVIAIANGWELDWANPATLYPYLKNAIPIEISGETNLSIKVPLQ